MNKTNKKNTNISVKTIKLINLVFMTLPFVVSWLLYYNRHIKVMYGWKGNITISLLYAVLYFMAGKIYDAFLLETSRISDLVLSQVLSGMIADGLIYVVIFMLSGKFLNIIPGLIVIAIQIIVALVWSYFAHAWYFKTHELPDVAIIYTEKEGVDKIINTEEFKAHFVIKKMLTLDECLKSLDILNDVDLVFISDVKSNERNTILKYCVGHNITTYIMPRIGDIIMSGAWHIHMFHLPILCVTRYAATPEYLFVKRFFDVVLSLLALIILSPILLITAIAIRVNDGGPVFYKQVRLTKDGKEFEILKFRSMKVDAEKDGKARLSTGENDDRITGVGKFIRKVRIDELPQLFNILKGDLSIVGPRPERPEIAKEYEKVLPEFNLRLQAKAGLTGYAQVYGKYNTTPYNKLQMDLMYIANPSLIADFKIILATIKILFVAESTEGLEEGKTNAIE